MKTTVDIPEDVMEESIKFTGAKTKRQAVVNAMAAFNRRERAEAFLKRMEEEPPLDFPSNDEIEAAEIARGNRAFNYFQSNSDAKEQ